MSPRFPRQETPGFEQATARLEEIVARMDDPQTGLEEMIALVEEGTALVRSSRKLLAEAELRIRTLENPDSPAPTRHSQPSQPTADPRNDDGFSLI